MDPPASSQPQPADAALAEPEAIPGSFLNLTDIAAAVGAFDAPAPLPAAAPATSRQASEEVQYRAV